MKKIFLLLLIVIIFHSCFLKDKLNISKSEMIYENILEKENSTFSLNLYSEEYVEGWTEMEDPKLFIPVYISPESVLTNEDLARVSIQYNKISLQYDLIIILSKEGGDKFYNFTSNNLDSIAVILVNDEIILSAAISSPISDHILVSLGYEKSEVTAIAKAMTGN